MTASPRLPLTPLNSPADPVFLVCASTQRGDYFSRSTLLGRSLATFPAQAQPRLCLAADNGGAAARGLPEIYNQAIEALPPEAVLVFVHDDIYIHDWNLAEQLHLALSMFDVVGLVGCLQAQADQPGWCFRLDAQNRPVRLTELACSGTINHFDPHQVRPDYFGPAPRACELVDGALLAVRNRVLKASGLRFDPRFRFHCYDTDFCRSARALGLTVGTWPLACSHGSPGNFSQQWVNDAQQWLQKWSASTSGMANPGLSAPTPSTPS